MSDLLRRTAEPAAPTRSHGPASPADASDGKPDITSDAGPGVSFPMVLRGPYCLLTAFALPLVTLALQWMLWEYIRPYAWFLFYPAVFVSSWLCGMAGGFIATLLSALLVLFFFIPPALSLVVTQLADVVSVGMFLCMGLLFSLGHECMRDAVRRVNDDLERQRAACDAADEDNARLRAANTDLALRWERAQELDALKTRFFANISHELRTPLTLLLGPLERLLDATPEDDDRRSVLGAMLRNARLLHLHVDDMLDLSRVDAGAMQLRYARADLSALTRATCAYFDTLAVQRGMRYEVQAPLRMDAQVDTDKYRRTLLNLLSNAFKFTPDGGSVSVTLERQDDEALLSVSDDGPGVPVHLRAAVFERYRQSGEGDRGLHGGSGLGLAIVKEFTVLHGGSASVEQGAEGGALFQVRLPLSAPPGVPVAAAEDATEGGRRVLGPALPDATPVSLLAPLADPVQVSGLPGGAGKDGGLVLVVEDNRDMSAFIVNLLRPHHAVAVAFDGEEGLRKALDLHPDLIVCDVMMPRVDGQRMVEQLRRYPGMADVPVLILTAKADDDLRMHLLRGTVQGYIQKPFAEGELLANVHGQLKGRARHKAELDESEVRFRATFEQAAMGLAMVALEYATRYIRDEQETEVTHSQLQQKLEEIDAALNMYLP